MRRVLLALVLVLLTAAAPRAWSAEVVSPAALEVARQDMVAAQLTELLARLQELQRDLLSNPGLGTDIVKLTSSVHDRLDTIRQVRLGHARKLLAEAARQPKVGDPRVAEAQQVIAIAAREIGSLLLHAGVSQATEVFAVEIREITRQQQAQPARGPAAAQAELAERTSVLVNELRALRDTPTDALALVRLARARKLVENTGVIRAMREAATAMADGSAGPCQAAALKGLREALQTLRPDHRLEDLIRIRGHLQEAAAAQQALRDMLVGLSAEQRNLRKAPLALQQEAALRPLAELDGTGQGAALGAALGAARQAGQDAIKGLRSGDAKATATAQDLASQCLGQMLYIVGEEIAKLSALSATHQQMLQAAERMRVLTEFRDRAEVNKNSALDLALANKSLETVVLAEAQLAESIQKFADKIDPANRAVGSLRRPLLKALRHIKQATPALQNNKLEPALPALTETGNQLKEAADIARRDMEMLERIWTYQQTSADVKLVNRGLDDLIAEVADLKVQVERAVTEKRTVLDYTSTQELLARALTQVQEQTGIIAEAAVMRTGQDAALLALGQAKQSLEKDQPAPALTALGEALTQLRQSRQAGEGIVTAIEVMLIQLQVSNELAARGLNLLQRQIDVREQTEDAAESALPAMAPEQDILQAEALVLSEMGVAEKATAAFAAAAKEMGSAIVQLKGKGKPAAVEHQKKAEAHLLTALQELDAFLRSLQTLAGEGKSIVAEYIRGYDAITAVLILATEQRELREVTRRTPAALLASHSPKQKEFSQERITEILELAIGGQARTRVQQSGRYMEQAVASLNAHRKEDAVTQQQQAEKELRIVHALLLRRVLELLPQPRPPNNASSPAARISDGFRPFAEGGWKEFSKADAAGKGPTGTKGEWNSLVARQRSALNENFARELPLEYRRLLKDYYEALSK